MPYNTSKITMPLVNATMNKAIGVGTAVAMAAPFSEPRRPDAPLAAPNLKLCVVSGGQSSYLVAEGEKNTKSAAVIIRENVQSL